MSSSDGGDGWLLWDRPGESMVSGGCGREAGSKSTASAVSCRAPPARKAQYNSLVSTPTRDNHTWERTTTRRALFYDRHWIIPCNHFFRRPWQPLWDSCWHGARNSLPVRRHGLLALPQRNREDVGLKLITRTTNVNPTERIVSWNQQRCVHLYISSIRYWIIHKNREKFPCKG